ncbi:hypothetical protein CHLRE_09g395065v5 [Chlamydomonas reinhardtii]|uniref:Uncharacterized protein n=1 Tax=Chlamydomonas reinhardtii TaxID=3055 RepID=A0A2K3DEI4_CHLRE|nr:uncharacterized protein CHLRE_09g395065v5 [Chlamydomonas reinhardtii]PNW78935.1 hypothetical protein CHLRE_09g395065v5 [Chlamydomonas reinhardtii]
MTHLRSYLTSDGRQWIRIVNWQRNKSGPDVGQRPMWMDAWVREARPVIELEGGGAWRGHAPTHDHSWQAVALLRD